MDFSIAVNTRTDNIYQLDVSSEFTIETLTVAIDGDETNNSFLMMYDEVGWLDIERDRNVIKVIVKDNYLPYERQTKIVFEHICDASLTIEVDVVQKGTEYSLRVFYSEIELSATKEENRKIEPVVKGGSEKFYVKSVKQYSGEFVKIETSSGEIKVPVEVEYDNGLILDVVDKTLNVNSLGRIFVDENNYYEITLAHKDQKNIECSIKVSYANLAREIKLDPDIIYFDGLGVIKDDSKNVVNISFGQCLDYGYSYKLEDSCDWIEIQANPTSLTIDCTVNYSKARTAVVAIKSIDDELTKKELTINQDGAEDKIIIDTTYIHFDKNGGEEYFRVYVYGGIREDSVNINLSSTLGNVSVVSQTNNTIYFLYYCKLQVSAISGNTDKEGKITISFGGLSKEITVYQSSSNEENNCIETVNPKGSGTSIQIEVKTPDDDGNDTNSMITVSTSAKWCSFNVSGHIVKFKEYIESNDLGVDRKCRVIVTNAENTEKSAYYELTQKADNTISIKFLKIN